MVSNTESSRKISEKEPLELVRQGHAVFWAALKHEWAGFNKKESNNVVEEENTTANMLLSAGPKVQ